MRNKFNKYLKPAFLMAVCLVAGVAQAAGADVQAFVQAHPGIASLALVGLIGETEIKGLEIALAKINDQVKEHGEKALAEAKRGIDMSTSVKTTVDELLVKQGELVAQVTELEQKAARRGTEDGGAQLKSMGYQLIESEDFKKSVGALQEGKGGKLAIGVKAITSASNSAGQGVNPQVLPGVLTMPARRLTIRDLVAPGRTASNLVRYLKETGFTNNAAPTGEGTRKPESTITYALTDASVKKIAHFIKASSEILEDFPALQSQIDGRLTYGLDFIEEGQLLKGSGSGNNLNGIYTQATAYSAPMAITGATRIDTLRLMLLQAELAEYPSDGIVLNPIDWAGIELTKDSTGQYIIGNPQGTLSPTLWSRPVVATQAMTVDTALVGAFKLAAQIFDRSDAGIVISTENEDDFVNNLVTILIERRLAFAVYRPEAFIKNANFDGVA
ncbi:phage major capsid protein [Massilia eurypsychrophila]|uniref:Phage major capsid protein n=2 Tax=Massilia eurypsychrophila TaxID=1485217 RepID=A0A2G8T8I0_9BURK|nr:phage major capsid protein [Massilia eurypsychrophila]